MFNNELSRLYQNWDLAIRLDFFHVPTVQHPEIKSIIQSSDALYGTVLDKSYFKKENARIIDHELA